MTFHTLYLSQPIRSLGNLEAKQLLGITIVCKVTDTLQYVESGVGLVIRVAAWGPRVLSSSPVGSLN